MKQRISLLATLLALGGLLAPVVAWAQAAATYPNKSIRIIVPFPPGGSSDILARSIGQKLTEMWSQAVVVENRTGADGNIGTDAVAKSTPDGYTLVVLDIGTLTMSPNFFAKLPFDPQKDFAPVTMLIFSPHALVVHPSVPANNLAELVVWSKANPGKLNFGSSSHAIHLAEMQLKSKTGMDLLHVPYRGGAAALTAIAGGEINILMNGLLATLSHIKGGRTKAIAVAAPKRMDATPEIPTLIESGAPDFVTGTWQALLAPAGTPRDVVEKLNAAVVKILNEPELKARLVGQGAEIVGNSPDALAAFIREESALWAKVAKEANIKPE